jgi:hypothetical protein
MTKKLSIRRGLNQIGDSLGSNFPLIRRKMSKQESLVEMVDKIIPVENVVGSKQD